MPDMLVNLLRLPPLEPSLDEMRGAGLVVRRAQPWELTPVREFAAREFSQSWADEISVGFARQPVTVYVALRGGRLVGFAAYECTRKNFFGPTGVVEDERGRGVGRALLLPCLWALREPGHAYAGTGALRPAGFYRRAGAAAPPPPHSPRASP